MFKLITNFTLIVLILSLFCSHLPSRAEETISYVDTARISQPKSSLKKSPTGALLRSVVLPGWGQLYTKQYLKAGIALALETTFFSLALVENHNAQVHKKNYLVNKADIGELDLYMFHKDRRNIYWWSFGITVFVSMWDAYVDAHLYGFEEEQTFTLHWQDGFQLGSDFQLRPFVFYSFK